MATTATQEEAEELRKIAVSGVQSVESDGRKVVYRSLDDVRRVLAEAGSGSGPKRRRFVIFSRGY